MRRHFAHLLVSALLLSAAAASSETVEYRYDELGRLKSTATTSGPNNGVGTVACFDPAGNRTRYITYLNGTATCQSGPLPTASPTP